MLGQAFWILLIDFGLMVFIWTIQLVVYPGFRHLSPEALLRWHSIYTSRVTVIVMPLMVAQIVLHGWRLHNEFSMVTLFIVCLVASTWLITFAVFVPLHNRIASNQKLTQNLTNLVLYNWLRTALWSLIFIIGVFAA